MTQGGGLRRALSALKAGWFRGNNAEVLSAGPRVGLTMASYAFYKGALTRLLAKHTQEASSPPRWVVFFAGAAAGATATLVTYPLDVARTRIAVGGAAGGALEGTASSLGGVLATLASTEGPAALYKGLRATLAGVLPFNSIKLATYDLLRRRANNGTDAAALSLPPLQSAFFGAVAGVVAATSCFPLELVRRRQMVGLYAGMGPLAALAAVVREEGASALFTGNGVSTIKVALGNGLGFYLYEGAKDLLEVDGRTSPLRPYYDMLLAPARTGRAVRARLRREAAAVPASQPA